MYKRVTMFSVPNWVYWMVHIPSMGIRYPIYKLLHKDFNTYKEQLRIVNELRCACENYGDKDKDGNWNIKAWYKSSPRSIAVKVRFMKKATDNVYDNYRKQIENYTYSTTPYAFRDGCGVFNIILDFPPIMQFKASRTSVSVGTDYQGIFNWDYSKHPHALILGETGQGKTTFVYYLIDGLLSASVSVWMIDGKCIDYNQYTKAFSNYLPYTGANYETVLDTIKRFKTAMQERIMEMRKKTINNYKQDKNMNPVFLIVDEYQVIAGALDKKQRTALSEEIGTIVRLGRAAGYILVITMQTAHSDYIPTAVRDNFEFKLVMGTASKTAYQMIFDDTDIKGLTVGKGRLKLGNDYHVLSIPLCDGIESAYLSTADPGSTTV